MNHGRSNRKYKDANLSEVQRRFVERFKVHGNASRAAKEADPTAPHPERRGASLLKQKAVFEALQAVRVENAARSTMERDEALERAAEIARQGADKDAINALKFLASMCGWEAPKKHEHHHVLEMSREEALAALRDAALLDPVLAAEIKRLGG